MKSICVFGASITSGLNDFEEAGWCERMKKFLMPQGYLVSNLGIIGESSTDLLHRMEGECITRKPDLILISIGCNDSQFLLDSQKMRVEKDETVRNFESLIGMAKKFTPQVVVVGLTQIDEERINPIFSVEKHKIYHNDTLVEYNNAIQTVVESCNVPFIPTLDLLEMSDLDDGLHPNSRGHEKLFVTVVEHLQRFQLIELTKSPF